ncbi:MAG: NUDIX hydrolase [Aestuariivirga sp.]|uniref:NUDIX hydrolase n=1 Tax=Aestuariivirga sp. TaxID=2650926 RepID=UPI0038D0A976
MNWQFNPRVAAIIQDADRNRILLCRKDGLPFWMLPGGRIEGGERAVDALRREVREELGADVKAIEFLWFIENLFQVDGRAFHEYGLYFRCDLAGSFEEHLEFFGAESDLVFKWVPKVRLSEFDLRPHMLREELMNLHGGMRYLEVRDP